MAPMTPTKIAAWVTAIAGIAFLVMAALVVPWDWLPGGQVRAVPATDVFTQAQIDRGESVSGSLRHLGWGRLAIGLVLACVLGFTPLGARLIRWFPGPRVIRAFLAVGLLSVLSTVADLPLAWRAQRIRLREGLSVQSWGSWLTDKALDTAVVWVSTGIAVAALVLLAGWLPRAWPAVGAAVAAGLVVLGSFVYPVVVEPLFNNFTSMPDGALRTRILALAEAENVQIDDVLVADASRRTTTINAYVSGLGSTRRVVVYDTLVDKLPPAEVEVVVAHELGHARYNDVAVGTTLGALGAGFGVGLLGLVLARRRLLERSGVSDAADPRVVPLVLALAAVAMLGSSPVYNTISRAVEARADRASLEATGESETFVAMQRQLALRSLADPTPPAWSQFWFGSHPTVLQRVGLAEQLQVGRR